MTGTSGGEEPGAEPVALRKRGRAVSSELPSGRAFGVGGQCVRCQVWREYCLSLLWRAHLRADWRPVQSQLGELRGRGSVNPFSFAFTATLEIFCYPCEATGHRQGRLSSESKTYWVTEPLSPTAAFLESPPAGVPPDCHGSPACGHSKWGGGVPVSSPTVWVGPPSGETCDSQHVCAGPEGPWLCHAGPGCWLRDGVQIL